MTNECWSCRALSGEQRISPGPIIFDGQYWVVEHAYPTHLKGWLVLVLKRHCEALHELTPAELHELGDLQGQVARVLFEVIGCEKEYSVCFAEAEHFHHIHFHLIPRAADLPETLRGAKVFALLKATVAEAIPSDEVRAVCEQLRDHFVH